MKSLIVAFLTFTLLSCSKNGIVSIPASLSSTADFAISSSSSNTFEKTFVIEASSNTDLQSKLSLIKEYEVTAIRYQVVNFSGTAGTKVNGTLTVGNITFPISNLALDQPTEYTLPVSSVQLDEIAADLLSGNNITVKVMGTINNLPAEFKIKYTVDVRVRI